MGSCRALQGKGQDAKEARSSCRKKTGQSGEASLEQGRVGGGRGRWESGSMGFSSKHTGQAFLRVVGEPSIPGVFKQRLRAVGVTGIR